MMWAAVDSDGVEYLYASEPIKKEDRFIPDESSYDERYLRVPKGTIKKISGIDLSFSDNPIEITEETLKP